LYGLFGPFAAAFMERFGMRRITIVALGLLAVGIGLTTWMESPLQLNLLWGMVVGMGTGCIASVLGAMVANRWFVAHRGLVVGILTASGAAGQLVFLPLLAHLVVTDGWRTASWTASIAAYLMI
ncbi:MFS transporter, partial [Frankia sp. Cpl3]|nr:MFS transporter [Frankia sp. Cpl3]